MQGVPHLHAGVAQDLLLEELRREGDAEEVADLGGGPGAGGLLLLGLGGLVDGQQPGLQPRLLRGGVTVQNVFLRPSPGPLN